MSPQAAAIQAGSVDDANEPGALATRRPRSRRVTESRINRSHPHSMP